jgi:D-amino-acid dehydrogenase
MARKDSPVRLRPSVVLRNPSWFLAFARRCQTAPMMAAGAALHALLGSSRSLYEQIIGQEHIDCDWQTRGLLFVFRSARAMDHYAEADHLLASRFATPARRLSGADLADFEPALRPGLAGAWLYERDAHLRPDRLMAGLRATLSALGVAIHEHRPATGFVRAGGRATAVQTPAGDLPADEFVIATGAWAPTLQKSLGLRVPIQPGKGYSMTFPAQAGAPTTPMIFEEDRVAVTPFADGLRLGSMMEFAGRDTSLDPRRLALLTSTANRYFRAPVTSEPTERWYGWRPMTPDGLPLIGPVPGLPNVLLAAGHNMLGVSLAPSTGKLIAELATGSPPHVDPSPYSPARWA